MVEYFPLLLTGVGIIVAIIYYTLTLRNANKTQEMQLETRKMQIFMQLYNEINSEERLGLWAELINMDISYEDYLEKYDSSVNPSFFGKRAALWYSFNTIGEMLRLEMIDVELLNRLNIDINVIVLWETWSHIIHKNREVENMPDLWDGFEYLYTEMKSVRDQKGYPNITIKR